MPPTCPRRLQILDNRAGDCSEHALLFVALARAAGIPAREVGGLAYPGDEPPLFGWHAWAEIHDGSQWVSVDPMWNQVYVDATHIKLTEDVSDLSWFNVVGRLKLTRRRPTQRMTRPAAPQHGARGIFAGPADAHGLPVGWLRSSLQDPRPGVPKATARK